MLPAAMIIHLAFNLIVSDDFDLIGTLILCAAAYFLYRREDYSEL